MTTMNMTIIAGIYDKAIAAYSMAVKTGRPSAKQARILLAANEANSRLQILLSISCLKDLGGDAAEYALNKVLGHKQRQTMASITRDMNEWAAHLDKNWNEATARAKAGLIRPCTGWGVMNHGKKLRIAG